jgi:hypothetical protein
VRARTSPLRILVMLIIIMGAMTVAIVLAGLVAAATYYFGG